MTARKMTKTAVTTEEVETHSTSVPSISAMPDTGRPYIRESSEFDAYVHLQKRNAEREIEHLDIEINRLQVEIEARLTRKQDLMTIVIKAETVLSMKDVTPTQPPKLTERANG